MTQQEWSTIKARSEKDNKIFVLFLIIAFGGMLVATLWVCIKMGRLGS